MKPSNIGGQAVMEGIMMRHKDKYAVAVRRPDKEIEIKVEDYKCTFGRAGFLKWPIIRGVVSFVDGLVVGTKCLMYSAEIAGDEEDEKEAAKNAALSEEELSAKKAKEAKQFQWLLYITVAISIIFSVAAFMLLPYALASLLRKVGASEFGVTVAEAFVKLALFLGYMFLISRMKDIQRTFMYHGAEHKCINCVEHGLPLTVENVMASSRQHKRCGTSFLFLVMLVSICLHFAFVLVPVYWVRLFGRLLMVPVVSGISFEIIADEIEERQKPFTVRDLMRVNLEDIHLLDTDVEHDLATIVELNEHTLTEEGQKAWSDVLNARVKRVYAGYYGTQVDVEGCDPNRLEAFSKMLAGECTLDEMDRWVNPSDDGEAFDLKFDDGGSV